MDWMTKAGGGGGGGGWTAHLSWLWVNNADKRKSGWGGEGRCGRGWWCRERYSLAGAACRSTPDTYTEREREGERQKRETG